MSTEPKGTRRKFLAAAGALGAGGLAVAVGPLAGRAAGGTALAAEAEVSPVEDLMREHGILRRVFLIYDEAAARLGGQGEPKPEVIAQAAGIVRRFVEDYHEKLLEEDQLFPRFEKAGVLVDLVKVLREQHQAGRRLTDQIVKHASVEAMQDVAQRHDLAEAMRLFNRMYRPHAAREDTVLFPAVHRIVSAKEYDALGDVFEDKEHELFGPDGFEKMVGQVEGLEKALGLSDLAQFTPKV